MPSVLDDRPDIKLADQKDVEAVKNFVIDIWNMKKTVDPEQVFDFIGRIFKNKILNENLIVA